jgi:hypothetical protein
MVANARMPAPWSEFTDTELVKKALENAVTLSEIMQLELAAIVARPY